jgi:hypothetical protein
LPRFGNISTFTIFLRSLGRIRVRLELFCLLQVEVTYF